MEILEIIIVSIIQGITEALPLSSSGHLLLFSNSFNIDINFQILTFLHLTTGIALVLAFWSEIKEIFLSKNRKYIIKILLISIFPSVICGLLFYQYISTYLHNNIPIILTSLIFWGLIMIIIDKIYFQRKMKEIQHIDKININQAIKIGLAQIIALIPGTSRSGITIMAGLYYGLNRRLAITFSFLIGIPIIIGVFFFEILKNPDELINLIYMETIIAGVLSGILTYLTILLLKSLAEQKFLTLFGIYRVILGSVFIILSFT